MRGGGRDRFVAHGPTDLLIFDLGGVLVENVGPERLADWLGTACEADALKARWLASPAVRDFELGRTSPKEFAERFVVEWSLPLEPSAFLAEFAGWPKGLFVGAASLLDRLRRRYRLACLSNSNALHWERFGGFRELFDDCFSSHLLGVIKPDADAFAQVVERCGVRPAQAVFFDDALTNVEAARRFGLRAHHVVGLAALEAVIARDGLV